MQRRWLGRGAWMCRSWGWTTSPLWDTRYGPVPLAQLLFVLSDISIRVLGRLWVPHHSFLCHQWPVSSHCKVLGGALKTVFSWVTRLL